MWIYYIVINWFVKQFSRCSYTVNIVTDDDFFKDINTRLFVQIVLKKTILTSNSFLSKDIVFNSIYSIIQSI